ncbi:hypothetical protein V2G26_017720 [Clonostachys chloroleuca]
MAPKPNLSMKSMPARDPSDSGLPSPYSPGLSSNKGSLAFTSKVTSVLSTSYSDTEFRDALALIDERGVQNDAETRRHLRLDLQKEVIDCNSVVIGEFGRVAEQLRRIKHTVDKLNSSYMEVKRQIESAHSQTEPALTEAASLLEQRAQIETKQQVLVAFKDHFILSSDEVDSLVMTSEPVDDRFFNALAKAKAISKDCEVLLGFEKQTLGLELMEQTSKNINLGFQKLYKWVQREFKTLNLENPQMNHSIRRALRVLAERPSLFQNCLDFFAEARERILSDAFLAALTGVSSSEVEDPSLKPIDMAAHDPLRYVGDMLAWIHSATVSEREALEILFVAEGEELAKGLKSGRDAEVWRLVDDEDEYEGEFNALKALHDLVDHDISGAARLLRQRVEQVIHSNEEIVQAYKLANHIGFYGVMFERLLTSESTLVEVVQSLQAEAMRQFRALVREHIGNLQSEFQQAPSDLGPPSFLQDSLKQLGSFIQTYDSSLSSSDDRKTGFDSVLAEAFDPFILGCENMAKSMKAPDDAIFLINCRLAAVSCLDDFDFTESRLQQVQEKLKLASAELTESQYSFFSEGSGLQDMLDAARKEGQEAEELNDPQTLAQASQSLDDFLPSALMDAIDRLKHLQDSAMARRITEEAAEKFCTDFEKLEKAVIAADAASLEEEDGSSESGEGGELRKAFPRTTAEIRVLLS